MDISVIEAMLEKQGYVASLWHVTDVAEVRPDLTPEQCMKVLKLCERVHDAEIGINWDVLSYHADNLFPKGGE